jgi:hypothetical protein
LWRLAADVRLMMNARPRLGHLLLEKGLLTEAELAEALRIHEQTGRPLGAILAEELRLVSTPTLADALLLQARWRPLGEMLVENGILDEDRLLEALDEQARTGKQLGEIVRERFYVSQAMLDGLLEQQRELEIEIERGYGTGLRGALLNRRTGETPTPETDDAASGVGLGERLEVARAGADPHVILAVKALEHRDEQVASLRELVEKQRTEIDHLRDSLQDRQLAVIELEQRVSELTALVAAAARPAAPAPNGR